MGCRLSKHKMTTCSENFGGHDPLGPLATPLLTRHIYGQRTLWRVSFTLRAVHLRFSMWFVIRFWWTIALGFVLFVDAG